MNGKIKGAVALVLLAAVIGAVNLILSSLPLRIDLTGKILLGTVYFHRGTIRRPLTFAFTFL